MVSRDVVAAKLADLSARVERVRKHCGGRASSTDLAADPDALDLVAFNLMLAVQICADIASHIIADAGWPGARTLAESFLRLHERGVLSQETSRARACFRTAECRRSWLRVGRRQPSARRCDRGHPRHRHFRSRDCGLDLAAAVRLESRSALFADTHELWADRKVEGRNANRSMSPFTSKSTFMLT